MKGKRKRIFIIGSGHSGTTILYRMLAYHPDLAWFCQYSLRKGKSIPKRFVLPFADALKKNLRQIFMYDWQKGRKYILIPRPGEMNSLWKYMWSLENIETRKAKMKEIIDLELGSWEKEAIIIKNPWIGQHADLINEALEGDCHFIHIVRDGRALVQSILHKHERYHHGEEALKSASHHWVEFLGQIIKFGEKVEWRNIKEVRYEDLVDDVPGTLENIMTFCGLDVERFRYDKVPQKLQSTNPKWINEQNREVLRFIEVEMKNLLQRYHYITEADS